MNFIALGDVGISVRKQCGYQRGKEICDEKQGTDTDAKENGLNMRAEFQDLSPPLEEA